MSDFNQEFNLEAYTDIDKLKEHIKPYLEAYFQLRDEMEQLEEKYTKAVQDVNQREYERVALLKENENLQKKARAWNIINRGADWENLRDLCDEEMCKELIKTGECDEEDFEGYECYEK
jgi:FtsZ-binding cell division protein ZapB